MKTIYTSRAPDGTIRMALRPMDASPNCKNIGFGEPKITWPFRVVYLERSENVWRISCRGDLKRGWNGNYFSGEKAAIEWLLKE